MNPISIAKNQDCMQFMAEFPDKFFDLAIVDPPYGEGENIVASGNCPAYEKSYKWNNKIPANTYFIELFRVSKNQIIWGANYFPFVWQKPSRGFIFWDKIQCSKNHSDGEMAWTSFDKIAKQFRYCFSANRFGFPDKIQGVGKPSNRTHPTQKPVALYKWLLTNYAKQGDKILDTHLGSGSSRIAAHDLGFDFYATELDADYFEAQEKRFAEHIQQPQLFEAEIFAPEQDLLFI